MSRSDSPACYLHRIGTAVPEQSIDMENALTRLSDGCVNRRSQKLLERIVRLAGVERRYLAALDFQGGEAPLYKPAAHQPKGPGMNDRSAAFETAARPLVARALGAFPAEDLARVQSLITVSCTHASSPGLERPVFEQSPVPPGVDRWNLGFMGCSAGLAALRLAHRAADVRHEWLVLACELSSLHFQYTDQIDQMTANLLFADGAAAVRLSPRPGRARLVGAQCAGLPGAADQMVWFAGDHGLQLRLSQDLPETLAGALPGAVREFLAAQGLASSSVDHWLVHPGGPQILDEVQRCLGLGADALGLSREILRTHGNMSSPTIFFIMRALLESSATGRAVALAFGPGLTIEMVLLELNHA